MASAGVVEVRVDALHDCLPIRGEELEAEQLVHSDQPVAVRVQHLGEEMWGLGFRV